MSFLMFALMVALAAATMIVLADSGLRLWFALGGIKAQHVAIRRSVQVAIRPSARTTTRVSYARAGAIPRALLRAAA